MEHGCATVYRVRDRNGCSGAGEQEGYNGGLEDEDTVGTGDEAGRGDPELELELELERAGYLIEVRVCVYTTKSRRPGGVERVERVER